MKKLFEIWIDDDDENIIGLCGALITKKNIDNNTSINCFNFSDTDLAGKTGFCFKKCTSGHWLVKTDDIVIDKDE